MPANAKNIHVNVNVSPQAVPVPQTIDLAKAPAPAVLSPKCPAALGFVAKPIYAFVQKAIAAAVSQKRDGKFPQNMANQTDSKLGWTLSYASIHGGKAFTLSLTPASASGIESVSAVMSCAILHVGSAAALARIGIPSPTPNTMLMYASPLGFYIESK